MECMREMERRREKMRKNGCMYPGTVRCRCMCSTYLVCDGSSGSEHLKEQLHDPVYRYRKNSGGSMRMRGGQGVLL